MLGCLAGQALTQLRASASLLYTYQQGGGDNAPAVMLLLQHTTLDVNTTGWGLPMVNTLFLVSGPHTAVGSDGSGNNALNTSCIARALPAAVQPAAPLYPQLRMGQPGESHVPIPVRACTCQNTSCMHDLHL